MPPLSAVNQAEDLVVVVRVGALFSTYAARAAPLPARARGAH